MTLDAVADAIDIVCQLAGDAEHVGLGTDFDGGQSSESAPAELDTIAELPKLASTLRSRGYAEHDIAGVMGQTLSKPSEAGVKRLADMKALA